MTQNTDIKSFLVQLGLSEKEADLYIASIKNGRQTASTLAKKTGFPRSTVNFLFDQMIQKGFAHKEHREKTTYFKVLQPDSLEYILLEKQAEAKKHMNDYLDILPKLSELKSPFDLVPKVTYFDGLNSLYRTIDDCCVNDESVWFISSHSNMHPKVRDYIERVYIPKSKKHKNKNRMILSDTPKSRQYVKKSEGAYDEVIFVDPERNPFHLTLAIHGNKVDLISYDPQDLSGVIIENKLIADHMRTMFEIIKKGLSSQH